MQSPRVCVLTPVYNGEKYLAECIESVLSQTYRDFEYHIVNNCSKDKTLGIAQAYALKDERVRVHTFEAFVGAIANHNRAFRLVPPQSKFCKVVSADDWILPECLGKMVHLAETHPSLGIVGCYQQSGETVKWQGLPRELTVLSGREACRLGLLKSVHVFGTPTSVLYRADLVRLREAFFPHPRSYADCSACYESLLNCDFGFLHETLSVERVHQEQWSTSMHQVDAGSVGYLDILLQYGPRYLTPAEFTARKEEVFSAYYRALGGCLLKLRRREFWDFQRSRLAEIGCELPWARIAKEAVKEALAEAKNPRRAFRKVVAAVQERFGKDKH
jgi:glycosyltransferase involved in cell wall biosynthesis